MVEARPGQIPREHLRCHLEPCVACIAMRNLTPEDWRVIDFYRFVRDQVVNITPNEEKYDHRPRLESWLAVGRERGLSGSDLLDLVEAARFLHETVQGRCPIPPLEWRLALEEELRPLPEPMDA